MVRMWHKVIFKESSKGFNSEFTFSKTGCHAKVKQHSLSYYLPIAGGRIVVCIPFQKVLVLCDMQTAMFTSKDSNHYTYGNA